MDVPDYKKRDEEYIRRVFQVPKEVVMSSFESRPKTTGWFGREGLWIAASFQFTPQLETRSLQRPIAGNRLFLVGLVGIFRPKSLIAKIFLGLFGGLLGLYLPRILIRSIFLDLSLRKM